MEFKWDEKDGRSVQDLFGIRLFYWQNWNDINVGFLQFSNVEFLYESMAMYNGLDVSMDMSGMLTVWDKDEEVWRGFACQIPEFMEAVKAKFIV